MVTRARGLLALSLALGVAAGCEPIIGFDGSTYVGAINAVCSCEEVKTAFLSTATCKAYFTAGLSNGTTADVDAWLKLFDKQHCDVCTPGDLSSKIPCIDVAPMCLGIGASCVEPSECCGFEASTMQCVHTGVGLNAECRACSKTNQPCNSSEECCGYHKEDAEPPYCSPLTHLCVVKPPSCKKTGEPCSQPSDCCGFEGGPSLVQCATSKTFGQPVCSEKCYPNTPDNCPGCCAVIDATMLDGGECRDATPAACTSYCDPANPTCTGNLTCKQTCFELGATCVYLCAQ